MTSSNWSQFFVYDETSPSCLRWRVDRHSGRKHATVKVKAGDVAGSFSEGYWKVKVEKTLYFCHRVIVELVEGFQLAATEIVDHDSRDSADNRLANLRVVTKAVNARNAKKSSNNATGHTGVKLQENFNRQGGSYFYYVAHAQIGKKSIAQCFSIAKLGAEEALRQAIAARAKMIEQLNAAGAGYTEHHGT